jgi:hypothetical protein
MSLSQIDKQKYGEVLNYLVKLVIGVEIDEIVEEKRDEVASEVLALFMDFLKSYIEETKGKRASMQFKILEANKDISLLGRFEGLEETLSSVLDTFVKSLETVEN